MALYYYVNKQSGYNNNHVVHAAGCPHLPDIDNRMFLGSFYHVNAAILQAKNIMLAQSAVKIVVHSKMLTSRPPSSAWP